jgi:hypothetical protein
VKFLDVLEGKMRGNVWNIDCDPITAIAGSRRRLYFAGEQCLLVIDTGRGPVESIGQPDQEPPGVEIAWQPGQVVGDIDAATSPDGSDVVILTTRTSPNPGAQSSVAIWDLATGAVTYADDGQIPLVAASQRGDKVVWVGDGVVKEQRL